MDPLFTFTPLTAHIQHANAQPVVHFKARLGDTGGLDTSSKDIRLGRDVLVLADPFNVLEEAVFPCERIDRRPQHLLRSIVHHVEFRLSFECLLGGHILPYRGNHLG